MLLLFSILKYLELELDKLKPGPPYGAFLI